MFSRKRRPVRIYLYLDPLGQIIRDREGRGYVVARTDDHDSIDDAVKEAIANSTGEDQGEWSLARLWGRGERLAGTFEQSGKGITLKKR